MWGDLFQPYNLRIFSKVLRRTEEAVLEIVTKSESKFLIQFLRQQKLWRIEEISSEGFVHVDYISELKDRVGSIADVAHVVVRRKSLDEYT